MFPSWNPSQPEITDLIVQHDPHSLVRLPVRKDEVLSVFTGFRNRQAIRVIEALPASHGFLDSRAIDRTMLAVHWEMQRLAVEFHHGARVWELLLPVIKAIRHTGFRDTLRIVDVGCGIGYTARWLAAHISPAAENIELLGVDLNSLLIREAARLALAENLPCRFIHGDAFSPEHSGHIFLSTGVVHHFRGGSLTEFVRRHDLPETFGFLHYDFQPWFLAPVGSWFFHILRMRTKLARHDGVLSAARAHSASTLRMAARAGAPGLASGIYGAEIWGTPAPRVFHTLVGIRRPLIPEFTCQLGRRARRLGELR